MGAIPAEPTGMPGPRPAAGIEDGSPPWSGRPAGHAVTSRDVSSALAMLGAEHRQVIVEIYYHHRSVDETAELMCIRASKVVSLASVAVRQLPSAVAASASRGRPDRTGCGARNGDG